MCWGYTFLKNPWNFFTLVLQIPGKAKLNSWNFHKIVLDLLEIKFQGQNIATSCFVVVFDTLEIPSIDHILNHPPPPFFFLPAPLSIALHIYVYLLWLISSFFFIFSSSFLTASGYNWQLLPSFCFLPTSAQFGRRSNIFLRTELSQNYQESVR